MTPLPPPHLRHSCLDQWRFLGLSVMKPSLHFGARTGRVVSKSTGAGGGALEVRESGLPGRVGGGGGSGGSD